MHTHTYPPPPPTHTLPGYPRSWQASSSLVPHGANLQLYFPLVGLQTSVPKIYLHSVSLLRSELILPKCANETNEIWGYFTVLKLVWYHHEIYHARQTPVLKLLLQHDLCHGFLAREQFAGFPMIFFKKELLKINELFRKEIAHCFLIPLVTCLESCFKLKGSPETYQYYLFNQFL